jgi:hypothetical protein
MQQQEKGAMNSYVIGRHAQVVTDKMIRILVHIVQIINISGPRLTVSFAPK